MLFSTLLVVASTAAPASVVPFVTGLFSQSSFVTSLAGSRSVEWFCSLNGGECGNTKFRQIAPNQPAAGNQPPVTVQKVSSEQKVMYVKFSKTPHSLYHDLYFQAKIRTAGPRGFPSFAEDKYASKLVNAPPQRASDTLTLDLDAFLGTSASADAWIQVVAYRGRIAIEKQCYPVQLIRQ